MKKTILISASILMFASSAFAQTLGSGTSTMNVTLSSGVTAAYTGSASGYVLTTVHSSGTFVFGTSSGDTRIWKSSNTGVALPSTPVGTASAGFAGDWKEQ